MAGQLDERVAGAIDRANASHLAEDEKEDAVFDELENDTELDAFREQRMESLQREWRKQKEYNASGHGSYVEIKDEKQLMDITTSTKYCIVHFWKPDFSRCRIMDSHLETLAPLHVETRFLRINVTNATFLVTKLNVQILPCVISFIDGMGKDRIIGFEGLGRGTDRFNSGDLEYRLLDAGVLTRPVLLSDPSLKVQSGSSRKHKEVDDDDSDWD